jgi:hypothetical protein
LPAQVLPPAVAVILCTDTGNSVALSTLVAIVLAGIVQVKQKEDVKSAPV